MRILHPPAIVEHILGVIVAMVTVITILLGFLVSVRDLGRYLHMKRI